MEEVLSVDQLGRFLCLRFPGRLLTTTSLDELVVRWLRLGSVVQISSCSSISGCGLSHEALQPKTASFTSSAQDLLCQARLVSRIVGTVSLSA